LENLIYEGSEGWIFLVGGSNFALDSYCDNFQGSAWEDGWAKILTSRVKKLKALNIEYCHVVAPEKISIYGPTFMKEEVVRQLKLNETPAIKIQEKLSSRVADDFIDPSSYLRNQSLKYQTYHKTDSHWNFIGAYSVYQLIMKKLKMEPSEVPIKRTMQQVDCVMDLGGKLDEPITEKVSFYECSESVSRSYANPLVQYKELNHLENNAGLHSGSIVTYENKNALHNKSILLFGDSFSEYRTHLLTGVFAESFQKVTFVWGLNIDYELIESLKPDIVISEAAERFMPYMVPTDDVDYERLSLEIIEKYESDRI
jgi:hypothetical protein